MISVLYEALHSVTIFPGYISWPVLIESFLSLKTQIFLYFRYRNKTNCGHLERPCPS